MALSVNKGTRPTIDFQLNYTPLNNDGSVHVDSLVLNLVRLRSEPIIGFHVRDQVTKRPVIARVSVNSGSGIDGTYLASDIYVNNTKRLKEIYASMLKVFIQESLLTTKLNQSQHKTLFY